MKQLECAGENVKKYALCILAGFGILFKESGLDKLNVPVAKDIPNKFINLCRKVT